MKIVFAGSPQYAVPSLQALVAAGKNVTAVITQPDKPTGRKRVLTPTPVKTFAQANGLPVYDFEKIRDCVKEVEALDADIMITCAYGQLLTQPVLDAFKGGVWNLHASLLPEFRGASPIQSAILAGKSHTGVTVMRTELSLDTGDILLVKRCEVGNSTYGELSEKLSELSAQAAVEAVNLIESGSVQLLLQDDSIATYCKKISKADAKVDFNQPAQKVARLINAMSPSPAAFCSLNNSSVNLLKAEALQGETSGQAGEVVAADRAQGVVIKCGEGEIKLLSAQFPGGKPLTAADLINGRKLKVGDRLD